MSFDGNFEWVSSQRKGGMRSVSFVLSNTNLLMSETFTAVIINVNTRQPGMQWQNLKLQKGKRLRFDFDTVGWDWCQGDTFAIVDSKGKIQKRWTLNISTPRPGECPECHGSQICQVCGGSGLMADRNYPDRKERCLRCFGSGQCITCYVPRRTQQSQAPVDDSRMQDTKRRKADALRQRISELEAQLEKAEWDCRMYQLKDMDVSCRSAYMSQVQYKTQLAMQIDKLRYQLQDLER